MIPERTSIMGLLSRMFGKEPESIRRDCIKIYEKARRQRPGKPNQDYLKLVLLTKPPYDYQHDRIIEKVLKECSNIEELADYIGFSLDTSLSGKSSLWEFRKRNLKNLPQVKERNRKFFQEFWG